MRISTVRAVVKELQNGIEAGVAIASGSNDLVTSTDDSNPDTPLGLIITIAVRLSSKDGVILHTIRKLTTVNKVSFFASGMDARRLFIEVDLVVATRSVIVLCSDEDVVSPAILGTESNLGTVSRNVTLGNTAHIVTVVVNLDLGIKHVELIATRSSDSLPVTVVSVTIPATFTLFLGTITRLFRSISDVSGVADENVREAFNVLSEPALSVVCLFIRHDSKREGNTLDGGRHRRNGDEVGVGRSEEDNAGTKTTIIIVVSDAHLTRSRMSGRILTLTLGVDIDNGIVDSGRAGASGDDNLTVGTLHTEEHGVLKILVTALRECGLEVVSLATEVVRKSNDCDSLIAVTVGVHGTLLDGKCETTTSVVETSNKHPVFTVLDRVPGDKGRTIAGIVVKTDTAISTSILSTLSKDSNDGIVVGVLVAGVSNERIASTLNLVPETRAESVLALILDLEASAGLTFGGVGEVVDVDGLSALIVFRGLHLRGGEVVDTGVVEEASDEDVVLVHGLGGELDAALPLVAAVVVHGDARVEVAGSLLARIEDEDDRIEDGTLIAGVEDDSLTGAGVSVPHTLVPILVSTALHAESVAGGGVALVELIHLEGDGIITCGGGGARHSNGEYHAQRQQSLVHDPD